MLPQGAVVPCPEGWANRLKLQEIGRSQFGPEIYSTRQAYEPARLAEPGGKNYSLELR